MDEERNHETATALESVGRGPNNTLVPTGGAMVPADKALAERIRARRAKALIAISLSGIVAVAAVAVAATDRGHATPSKAAAPANAVLTAASSAAATQSADFTLSATTSSPATTTTLFRASGAYDLGQGEGEATATVPLLSTMTAGLLGAKGVHLLVSGSTAYVQIPGASAVLGSNHWLSVPLGAHKDVGLSPTSFTGLADPAALVRLLGDAGGPVTTTHGVDVDGTSTTEYATSITLSSLAAKADPSLSGSTVASILDRLGLVSVPLTAWVGPGGLLRQISLTVDLSHANLGGVAGSILGTSSGTGSGAVVTVTAGFTNYGRPVSVSAPPASDTTDLSSAMGAVSGLSHSVSGLDKAVSGLIAKV